MQHGPDHEKRETATISCRSRCSPATEEGVPGERRLTASMARLAHLPVPRRSLGSNTPFHRAILARKDQGAHNGDPRSRGQPDVGFPEGTGGDLPPIGPGDPSPADPAGPGAINSGTSVEPPTFCEQLGDLLGRAFIAWAVGADADPYLQLIGTAMRCLRPHRQHANRSVPGTRGTIWSRAPQRRSAYAR